MYKIKQKVNAVKFKKQYKFLKRADFILKQEHSSGYDHSYFPIKKHKMYQMLFKWKINDISLDISWKINLKKKYYVPTR